MRAHHSVLTWACLLLAGHAVAIFAGENAARASWPPAWGVMSNMAMCQPKMLSAIAPVRITAIQWGSAIYPREVGTGKRSRLAKSIARVHAIGAKYIGSINGGGYFHRSLNSEAIISFEGKLRYRRDSKAKIYKCWFRPKMFQAFVDTAKRCVDVGMDGFVLDDWSVSNQLCFCDRCLALYRGYVRAHKDDPLLKRFLKGVDVDTFDYGQYLRDRGVDPSLPDWKLPLGWQLKHYRRDQLIGRIRSFWETVRAYAEQKGGRPFYLTANVSSMGWTTFAVSDLLDYFLVETMYFGTYGGLPPRGASIALHKKTRMAGKRGVLQPGNVNTVRRLIGRPSIATLYKIWIAEAYASGNLFHFIPRTHGGIQIDGDKGTKVLDLPIQELKTYYAFFQQHPQIYTATTSPAKIAVLYVMCEAVDKEFMAACKLLYDAHYQFDAVLIGDGQKNRSFPSAEVLARYKAIVLPLAKIPLPAAAIAELAKYQRAGGQILPSSEFLGFHRSKRAAAFAPLWKQLTGRSTASDGLRSFTPYLKSQDARARDEIKTILEPDPVLQTNASSTVGVLQWRAGPRELIHLVNYDYIESEDAVKDAANIRITVNTSARTARLFSPDDGKVTRLTLQRDGGRVSFTVPKLHVYSVVVLE